MEAQSYKRSRLMLTFWHPAILTAILILNMVGAVWGLFWYRVQLAATKWFFLPFVPDCPLIVVVFALYLYFLIANASFSSFWQQLLAWTATLGALKYGIWTVVIIGQYFFYTSERIAVEEIMLFIGHLGMIIQAVVYFKGLPRKYLAAVIALLFFSFNDYFDYSVGTHPYLPLEGQTLTALEAALATTAMVSVIVIIQWRKHQV